MKVTPHIHIDEWNDQCLLTVRDEELFDFLDDFFHEANLDPLAVFPPDEPGTLQLLFPPGVSRAHVYRLMAQIDPDEIERIVRINAPSSDDA